MLSETDPEMLRALAPYQDAIASLNRKADEIEAVAAEQHAAREKEFAETLQRQQTELAEIKAARAEQRRQAEEKDKAEGQRHSGWRAPRREQTEMRFGPEDEEYAPPPSGGPTGWPRPPVNQPRPPAPPTPPPPVPTPPPAPSRRPAARRYDDDDDDDMSGQSWMR
jgi:hypothetical protein